MQTLRLAGAVLEAVKRGTARRPVSHEQCEQDGGFER